ncbi:porin [Thiomicrorhabdus aquaedulcis]|uniref:porin n=1 Tax=Thiomicrorhabdus aquaedulcis TaxID=2211106 RepID=UPI000FD75EC9|nr:porin [Thiomicrorhabdus aquaedulcis]
MKKNIIALAIASTIAAPVAFADAPTVYGQVNMAVEQVDLDEAGVKSDSKSGTQVNSRASRLGIKGSEDLGNGLKAVYGLEFQVNIDTSDVKDSTENKFNSLTARNQFVGLAGGFGTVLMGRHDTPFKMSQGQDLFNDSGFADIAPLNGSLGAFNAGGEIRVANTVAYVSPEFAGVKLAAAFVPKETGGDQAEESSLSDLMSAAVMYGSTKKGLYLSAAVDQASAEYIANTNNDNINHLRLVAQYATGGLMANVMYQDFSGDAIEGSDAEGSAINGQVGYTMGKFMPKLSVASVDREKKFGYEDSTNYAVGLDYSFGKKTVGYVEYTALENIKGEDKTDTNVVSVGMNHKF